MDSSFKEQAMGSLAENADQFTKRACWIWRRSTKIGWAALSFPRSRDTSANAAIPRTAAPDPLNGRAETSGLESFQGVSNKNADAQNNEKCVIASNIRSPAQLTSSQRRPGCTVKKIPSSDGNSLRLMIFSNRITPLVAHPWN
jgi:hypothetical protein